MEIGAKLRELRVQKSLTQKELADRCELSKGFISQVERDLTSPSIATLIDISGKPGHQSAVVLRRRQHRKGRVFPGGYVPEAGRRGQERKDHLAGPRRAERTAWNPSCLSLVKTANPWKFRRMTARSSAICSPAALCFASANRNTSSRSIPASASTHRPRIRCAISETAPRKSSGSAIHRVSSLRIKGDLPHG